MNSMNRRVLIVAYSFPPIADAATHRTLKFVKYLPSFGWQPVVLTVADGVSWAYDADLLMQVPKGVPVVRARSWELVRLKQRLGPTSRQAPDARTQQSVVRALKNFAKRWLSIPDDKAGWIPFAVAQGRRLCRQIPIDVLFTTSSYPSAHIVGLALKRATGVPWVADFQDPWVTHPLRVPPPRLRLRLEEWLERQVIWRSDLVIAATQPMTDAIRTCYPQADSDKFVTVENGYDPDDFTGVTAQRPAQFTIVHIGSLYGARTAEPFLRALAELVNEEPVLRALHVEFIGSCDECNQRILDKWAQGALRGVVVQCGQQPYRAALQAAANAHVRLVITDPGGGGIVCAPTKVFEYLHIGGPILAVAPRGGETARIVRETETGLVVDCGDVTGIKSALKTLWRAWQDGQLHHFLSEGTVKRFHRYHLAQELAARLEQLTSPVRT